MQSLISRLNVKFLKSTFCTPFFELESNLQKESLFQNKFTWEKLFEAPNFFAKYRHFIVLEASSSTEEDQLEWFGLVESKVRHLISNLEREAIELAHVWPKTYPSLEEGKEKTCCYWFVGLIIKQKQTEEGGQPQNLDLTTPIKAFTELVMRAAISINVRFLPFLIPFYDQFKNLNDLTLVRFLLNLIQRNMNALPNLHN